MDKNQPGSERHALIEAVKAQQATIGKMAKRLASQDDIIENLVRTVRYIGKVADIEHEVTAGLGKIADDQNPAQPVPSPGGEAPAVTTEEARKPDTTTDVMTPGGASSNTAPGATTSVDSVGGEILPPDRSPNKEDVTAPVSDPAIESPPTGQDAHAPVDVHFKDKIETKDMFPWTLSAKEVQERTIASIRLARLRLAAKTADGNDLDIAESIVHDAKVSNRDIANEIQTLTKVVQASRNAAPQPRTAAARGLVPQGSGQGQRRAPSLQGAPRSVSPGFRTEAAIADDEAEIWFGDIGDSD